MYYNVTFHKNTIFNQNLETFLMTFPAFRDDAIFHLRHWNGHYPTIGHCSDKSIFHFFLKFSFIKL